MDELGKEMDAEIRTLGATLASASKEQAANEGQELNNMWVDLGKEMIARRYDHRLQGTGRDARRQEQVETRGATITDSKEQVETLGATIRDSKEQVAQKVWEPDDDERWEVLVLGYFWKNGRPKFKYIIIEKEVECKKDMPIFVNRSKAMM